MMNKRLIDFVPESRKYIAGNVALQWVSLLANIGMMTAITQLLGRRRAAGRHGDPCRTGRRSALCLHHRGVSNGLFVLAHGQKSPA